MSNIVLLGMSVCVRALVQCYVCVMLCQCSAEKYNTTPRVSNFNETSSEIEENSYPLIGRQVKRRKCGRNQCAINNLLSVIDVEPFLTAKKPLKICLIRISLGITAFHGERW